MSSQCKGNKRGPLHRILGNSFAHMFVMNEHCTIASVGMVEIAFSEDKIFLQMTESGLPG